MVEHFGILLPYLLSQVQDRRVWFSVFVFVSPQRSLHFVLGVDYLVPLSMQPLIRVSACWTLGQYAQYIVSDDSLLPKILPVILPACLDHTKKVLLHHRLLIRVTADPPSL